MAGLGRSPAGRGHPWLSASHCGPQAGFGRRLCNRVGDLARPIGAPARGWREKRSPRRLSPAAPAGLASGHPPTEPIRPPPVARPRSGPPLCAVRVGRARRPRPRLAASILGRAAGRSAGACMIRDSPGTRSGPCVEQGAGPRLLPPRNSGLPTFPGRPGEAGGGGRASAQDDVPHGPLFSPLIMKNRGRGGPPRHTTRCPPRSGLRGADGRWAQPGASSLQGLRPALQRTQRHPIAPQRPTTPQRPAAPTSCGAHPRRRPPSLTYPGRPGQRGGRGRERAQADKFPPNLSDLPWPILPPASSLPPTRAGYPGQFMPPASAPPDPRRLP